MRRLNKLHCHEGIFHLLAALFFALVLNLQFLLHAWRRIAFLTPHDYFFALSLPLVLTAGFCLIFNLIALPGIRKPLLLILILASAAANYFMYSFGTVIDTNMIQNIFETNLQEAAALLSPRYLLWMLLMGLLPVVLLCSLRIIPGRSWWQRLAVRLTTALAALLVILLAAALFYKDYASLIRNNKGLVKMITPANIVSGSGHYIDERWLQGSQALVKIGLDAHKGALIGNEKQKTLVILVVGETARAENFALGGYARDTTPQLKNHQVIYYPHAYSCGTETTVSVPCMFSGMPRSRYDAKLARHQEGLLDVLAHAGISVLWRENDGGCKGACDRVPHTDMTQWKLSDDCRDGYCLDNALLYRLNEVIGGMKNDGLIVLHQMGSHGPAYFLRYPPAFKRFTPTCDSNQIQDCDRQALINTYDNTLLYTDAMLSKTIDLLKSRRGKDNVALIYLSDHGESLGEHGMYLHGAPYLFAPEQQTHIPLLLWMSDSYARTLHIDQNCLRQQASRPVSQDNLFHTLLGMFDIQTQLYQPALDITHSCRNRDAALQ